jgi:hypothetical protein
MAPGGPHEWRQCDVFRRIRLITGETVPALTTLMRRWVAGVWQYRRLTDEEAEQAEWREL